MSFSCKCYIQSGIALDTYKFRFTSSEYLSISLVGFYWVILIFVSTAMKGNTHLFRFLFFSIQRRNFDICHIVTPCINIIPYGYFFSTKTTTHDLIDEGVSEETGEKVAAFQSKNAAQVFRKWGCNATDLTKIFHRQPSLRNACVATLESKLSLLSELGIGSSDLVKMINCRPRFLSCRLNRYFGELRSLFGSYELFLKAIVRNPSMLVYDFNKTVKPVVSLYEQLGVSRSDFISMLMLRPTLIPRTHMSQEKLDYILRTGVSKESKMYKYVVTILGISRIETIREKMANFEKFGFTEDEVLGLFGRSPLLMTLSVDKVQRNMTFVVGTMKYPCKSVAEYPFLLYASLENVLKPRVLLARKIRDMNLCPQIRNPYMMTALRMPEERFLNVYVMCHEQGVRDELLEYYQTAKGIKRLAESSRKTYVANGFPF